MAKRVFFVVTLLLVAGVVAGWYFFAKESRYFGTSPLSAIPANATICIKIKNLGVFFGKTAKNSSWKSLSELKSIESIHKEILSLDTLIDNEAKFLQHKECYLVWIDKVSLYLFEIGSFAEKSSINILVQNYFLSKNAKQSLVKYKDATLQKFEWDEANVDKSVFVAIYRGIFIAGRDARHLQMAVDQMDRPSLLEDVDFNKVNKNTAENTDLNIFVSLRTITSFIKEFFLKKQVATNFTAGFSGWTEIDVLQKDNRLIMNGYTVSDTTSNNYQGVFRRQKPVSGTLTHRMPSTTSFFALQNAPDPDLYLADYFNHHRLNGGSDSLQINVSQLSSLIKIDVRHYLANNWTGEVATVFTNQNMEDSFDNQFFLMKIRDDSRDALVSAIREWASNQPERKSLEWISAAKRGIWRVPFEDFGKLTGNLCYGTVKTRWITAGDGFLLMGSTPGSLMRYLDLLRRDELLVKSPAYAIFADGLVKNYNFFLWCAPGHVLPFLGPYLNPIVYHKLENSIQSLAMVNNFSWQWVYENGNVYNSVLLTFQPEVSQKRVPFWSYAVEGKVIGKPVFVSFEREGSSNDLVFQREDNTLIALGKDGLERWRIALEGAIIGEINTVYVSRDGLSQLLFNTKKAIHLINHDGSEMKNFPIWLRSNATNGVAMFDYDGNKEYRFMVACSDYKLYNFDQRGNSITGWKPRATKGFVEFPVHHFKDGSKDYLVCFDRSNTYILDRHGNTRVRTKVEFEHSQNDIFKVNVKGAGNMMVTTDKEGSIRLIKFDGSTRKVVDGKSPAGHFFTILEVEKNGNRDFLLCDKKRLSRFDSSGRLVFTFQTPFVVDQPPSVFKIGQMDLICLTSKAENRSILLRADGSEFNSFKFGNRLLLVGAINEKNQVGNLVELTPEGSLSNYQISIK